jgi:hypothetical protein
MDKKQEIDNFDDIFLKNILDKTVQRENAPKDFTKKTMNLVMQEWIENPIEETSKKHGYKYWCILIALIIVSSGIYLATDIRTLISMSDITWLKTIDHDYLVYIHSSYTSILDTFTSISPIFYIVLAAMFSIFIVDKLIKRIQTSMFSIFFI